MKRRSGPARLLTSLAISCLLVLAGCSSGDDEEESTTDKALRELQAKYDELAGDSLDEPVQWASEDIENIGDWEYVVREVPFTSAVDLESELNTLGDDRWELAWMERTDTGFLLILKKPSISWLSKIPLSQIGRLMIGDSDAVE